MDGLEKFWNDLVEVTPKPITEETVEILGLPSDGNDPVKADETAERTKALEDALARISELEKKLSDINNEKDGLHIES